MTLDRALELFALDISNARPSVRGGEPEVRIPVSMANLYLEAMREAETTLAHEGRALHSIRGRG